MKKIIKFFKYEESGQGLVEYTLILAVVFLAVITGLNILSETTKNLYKEAANKLPS